mmetsp:Transcript_21632/g.53452  ORF Transcript_21632/g.53452 Transcript_21632/m.53452 type:complete len:250 (+) Transcript_21632:306-1055(+)
MVPLFRKTFAISRAPGNSPPELERKSSTNASAPALTPSLTACLTLAADSWLKVVSRMYSTFCSVPAAGAHSLDCTGTSAYFRRVTVTVSASASDCLPPSAPSRASVSSTLEPAGPCSASATSYRLRPWVGRPSTATMLSAGRTPASSAGPPGVGATTTTCSPPPAAVLSLTLFPSYAISIPTPVMLADMVDSERDAYFSGSRKRVNGSSSLVSMVRMAAYVSSVLSIGTFFTVSSRYLNHVTPLNVLST